MISDVHTQTGLSVLKEILIYNMHKDAYQACILQIGFATNGIYRFYIKLRFFGFVFSSTLFVRQVILLYDIVFWSWPALFSNHLITHSWPAFLDKTT